MSKFTAHLTVGIVMLDAVIRVGDFIADRSARRHNRKTIKEVHARVDESRESLMWATERFPADHIIHKAAISALFQDIVIEDALKH